jgi:O-antigen ligase
LSPSSILQTTNKARGKSIALIPHNLVTYPFGAGLATAGPAALSAPGGSPLTLNPPDTETEFSYLTVETGIAGMLVLAGFTITLLVLGIRRCRKEPDPEARALLAALIAPVAGIFAIFFTSAPTSSVPLGPYIWAIGGIASYWLVARPAARRRSAE